MDKLDQRFAWKYFVVGVVALALTGLFTVWYAHDHHPDHGVPTLVEAGQ